MDRNLPPLNAVKVFDSVVRHGSLSAAARALHISQSAVSKHIGNLESYLGAVLLRRSQSGTALTSAGEAFYQTVGPALASIAQATMACRATAEGIHVLRISAPASISVGWLAPRLTAFQQMHPDIVVDLTIADTCPDFATSGHDGAVIPCAAADASDTWAHVFDEVVTPVCSPTLATTRQLSDATDIARCPLIHTSTRSELWTNWFRAHTPGPDDPAPETRGFGFQDFYLSIAAAKAGLGIALVPTFLVAADIAEGTLITPRAQPLHTGHAYWLAKGPSPHTRDHLKKFSAWLINALTPPAPPSR
ncbi:MAG: LysR substrate-binding domain-containing protein [Pseudomonadota bacterium]